MKLSPQEAQSLIPQIRVEWNDANATPVREWDYVAWVPRYEEELGSATGRTPESARAAMAEQIEMLIDDEVAA